MRISMAAIFTLVAIGAQGFTNKASAIVGSPLPTPDAGSSKLVVPDHTPTQAPLVSIAAPETLAAEPLAAPFVGSAGSSSLEKASLGDSSFRETPTVAALPPDDSMAASAPGTATSESHLAIATSPTTPQLAPVQLEEALPPDDSMTASPAVEASEPQLAIATYNPSATPAIEPAQSTAPAVPQEFFTRTAPQVLPPDDLMVSSEPPKASPKAESQAIANARAGGEAIASSAPQSQITRASTPSTSTQPVGQKIPTQFAQERSQPTVTVPSTQTIQDIQNQLRVLQEVPDLRDYYRGSPSFTIVTPSGYGADDNTGFVSAMFQTDTRYGNSNDLDGGIGFGIGLGDARKAVGVELSYALASLTEDKTDFGRGGFNLKVHRQFPGDFSVAVGWNGFLNIQGGNDFQNSIYGAATKIFRLRDDIKSPLSRLAVTAGVGNGQFRSERDVEKDRDTVNVFGSASLRVAEPISLIAEWTGQDLGVGVSIVPFKNLPLVITPAVRDITGAGDGARFVIGTGFSFKF